MTPDYQTSQPPTYEENYTVKQQATIYTVLFSTLGTLLDDTTKTLLTNSKDTMTVKPLNITTNLDNSYYLTNTVFCTKTKNSLQNGRDHIASPKLKTTPMLSYS